MTRRTAPVRELTVASAWLAHQRLQAVGDVFGGAGIGVAGGADLDGGGAGEQELDGVFGA